MIEALIERNPGDIPKKVNLDSALRGCYSGQSPNFEQMFKVYCFSGHKHFGTKADVIDLRSFLDFFRAEFSLDDLVTEGVMKNPVISALTNSRGYLTCFWDLPSQLHHRDLMRYCFSQVADGLGEHCAEIGKRREEISRTPWIHNYGKIRDELAGVYDRVETAQLSLMVALDELSEAKVASASTELGPVARKIIESSQGYLLYSEDPEDAEDISKSRIYRLKLESKITKDQRTQNIMPTPEAVQENIRNFLGSLQGVDIRTNRIFLPESHTIPSQTILALSYESPSRPMHKELKVQYESPDGKLLVC